jgi:predicted lipoprotein with Yx(FWY)xxD motif
VRIKHWIAVGATVLVATVALAACGDDDEGDGGNGGGAAAAETVSVESIGDAGDVLVNRSGAALYTPEQEANGKIVCTAGCTSIWVPVTVPKGQTPTGPDDVGGMLGTVQRPDGSTQVTFDGGPLYTFTEEGPGEVTGDGFEDTFDGTRFVWQVATPSGAGDSQEPAGSAPSSGYSY